MRIALAILSVLAIVSCGQQDLSNLNQQENDVVIFEIPEGTGAGAWNTQETMVTLSVGQTLRIVNLDSERHRLHTNGRPCPHGPIIDAAQQWDCEATQAFDSEVDGPLWDHYHGRDAAFWLKVTE